MDGSDLQSRAKARWARVSGIAILVAVFAGSVLFRLATASVVNDDYLHLSTAQQVVLGAMPVRDFIDPGELLFYSVSAAAQLLLGRSVLSEVILDVVFISLGHALVFVLASRAAGSRIIGLVVTGVAVLLVTRLYSYPKIFLYPLALVLMWRYADDRRGRNLFWVALCTAAAFLFRHDHGAYIGVAMLTMLVMAHWEHGWRAVSRTILLYGASTAVLLLPFFVFVQINVGSSSYWRNTIETARGEYQRTVGPWPVFHVAPAGIVPIRQDPPSQDENPNVTAWLYYLTILMPPLTILMVALDHRHRRDGRPSSARSSKHEATRLIAAAVLATLMHAYLLRAASDSAIADVSTLTAVLGAWLLGRGLKPGIDTVRSRLSGLKPISLSSRRSIAWPVSGAAFTLIILATTLNYSAQSEGGEAVQRLVTWLQEDDRNPIRERLDRFRQLSPPYDDDGARYVFNCTFERDRLLITAAYSPDLYYAAGRGFAAGRLYYLGSLAPSPEHEALSLQRLRDERVPIILVYPPDYPAFVHTFRSINQYVVDHYRDVGEIVFREGRFRVLADKRITPAGAYGPDSLPCFRPNDVASNHERP